MKNHRLDYDDIKNFDLHTYRTICFYMSTGWDEAVLSNVNMTKEQGDIEVKFLLSEGGLEDEAEITKLNCYINSPNQQGHFVAKRLFKNICDKYPCITGHLILSFYS